MPLPLTPALLMLGSGSLHAVVNTIVKGGKDKMAARAVTDASSALILLPATLFVPWPTGAWTWLAASAVVHALYLYALIRAYQLSDLSAVYPVLRGTAPLLTALITVGALGEPTSAVQIGGVALVGASIAALAAGRHLGRDALGWALLTGTTIAVYTVIDARGVRAAPVPGSYVVWLFVTMGVVVAAMFGLVTRGAVLAAMRAGWRPGAAAGRLSILTYGMALFAFAHGPTAPLAALRETGTLTALVLAVFGLGERVTRGRLVAVLGIVAGAALILAE